MLVANKARTSVQPKASKALTYKKLVSTQRQENPIALQQNFPIVNPFPLKPCIPSLKFERILELLAPDSSKQMRYIGKKKMVPIEQNQVVKKGA